MTLLIALAFPLEQFLASAKEANNPFTLIAFAFVLVVFSAPVFISSQLGARGKAISFIVLVVLLFSLTTIVAVAGVNSGRAEIRQSIVKSNGLENGPVEEPKILFHLVRGGRPVEIASGLQVELADIETLKGKQGLEFNRTLADSERILSHVLSEAGITNVTASQLLTGSSDQWDTFLQDLTEDQRETVKEIPFARFKVLVDNNGPSEEFLKHWYFKGEVVTISRGETTVKFRLENVYNTKHKHSGEPEAVNIRLLAH